MISKEKTSLVITGISGFVGLNLTHYLNEHGEYRIIGASRNPSEVVEMADIVDKLVTNEAIIQEDQSYHAYIHLAGKVFDMQQKSEPSEYYRANFDLTKQLFDHFIEDKQADKFIFLSTIHALTESAESELTENFKPIPVTPYGVSKLKAERYMVDNCPPEKKVYILRPSMIHGPGNKGSLNLLYSFISRGIPYPMGAYNNKRSFVSIENLCFVINEILNNEISEGLYHIADDKPTYTHDLVKLIAEFSGVKARIWNVSPWLIRSMSRLGNVMPFPLNDYRFNKLAGDFIVSNEKIKNAIGKPLPVSAEEGIRRTLNSFNS